MQILECVEITFCKILRGCLTVGAFLIYHPHITHTYHTFHPHSPLCGKHINPFSCWESWRLLTHHSIIVQNFHSTLLPGFPEWLRLQLKKEKLFLQICNIYNLRPLHEWSKNHVRPHILHINGNSMASAMTMIKSHTKKNTETKTTDKMFKRVQGYQIWLLQTVTTRITRIFRFARITIFTRMIRMTH